MKLHKIVLDMESELVRVRRALHMIPEEAYKEFKTSQFIKEYLHALGPDSITDIAKTGVKAVFDAGAEKTVAIRADMDALPIEEQNNFPHKSTHPGFMHACGHDGHMAVALCFAKIISLNRNKLKTNFVFLFQPAEETIGGAQQMIKEGALENPHVDEIYGIHLWPDVPKGKVGFKDGPMMANMCDMNIRIVGKSAHGAAPQEGKDALLASAHFIVQANSIISRNIAPSKPAVLNIGCIKAGDARNVVCGEAIIEGTIRSFDDTVSEIIKDRIHNIMKGIDKAFGTQSEYFETMDYPVLINDRQLYLKAACKFLESEIISADGVMMAEDFTYFAQKTKGLFAFIGTGGNQLHSNSFNFDEDVLSNALEYYIRTSNFE